MLIPVRCEITVGLLTGASGRQAEVVAAWIVKRDEDFPRLVTVVRVSGQTQALVTLRLDDVRPVGDEDLVAMRTPEDSD